MSARVLLKLLVEDAPPELWADALPSLNVTLEDIHACQRIRKALACLERLEVWGAKASKTCLDGNGTLADDILCDMSRPVRDVLPEGVRMCLEAWNVGLGVSGVQAMNVLLEEIHGCLRDPERPYASFPGGCPAPLREGIVFTELCGPARGEPWPGLQDLSDEHLVDLHASLLIEAKRRQWPEGWWEDPSVVLEAKP